MPLSDFAVSMLRAVFALGALTFLMAVWMSIARSGAMSRGHIALQEGAHTAHLRELLPSSVRRVGDNYNHLFEAPTVFYAVTIAIVVAGLADAVYVYCAWGFVVFRALHSVVQATFNRVAVRATLYGLSWLALAVLIIRPLFSL